MPTVVNGFHVNPKLPVRFDSTPNQNRPASHRQWWGIPYVISNRDDHNEVISFDVRRLDGGAWDRSTSLGQAETLEAAIEICHRAAQDEMFKCTACLATTLARYSGPMALLETEGTFNVVVCPVCGFVASKVKVDKQGQ